MSLRLVDRGILLGGIASPFFDEDSCAEGFRDRNGAIGRARVDHDDLAFAVGDQRLHAGERAPDVGLFVVSDDGDREDHAGLLPLSARACRAPLGLDPSTSLREGVRGRQPQHERKSLPSFARLGRAGAPVPTPALTIESFTERGYARGGMQQKKNAATRKRRAGTPGAPSLTVCGATVAVGPEGSTALAGRRAVPPRAEYSVCV